LDQIGKNIGVIQDEKPGRVTGNIATGISCITFFHRDPYAVVGSGVKIWGVGG